MSYDEASLINEAGTILGNGEEIRAAGVFALKDLVMAGAAGAGAGGITGDIVGGNLGNFVGAMTGMRAGQKAAAEAQDATIRMIVAVTDEHVYVLNRDTGGRLDGVRNTFDRSTLEVTVKKFGLSRHLTLEDPATGDSVELTGNTTGFAPTGAGDKAVFALIAA